MVLFIYKIQSINLLTPRDSAKRAVSSCETARSASQNGVSCKAMETRALRESIGTVTKYDKKP